MGDERDVPAEEAIFREWGFHVDEIGVWHYRGRCTISLDPFPLEEGGVRFSIELPNGYTIQGEVTREALKGEPPPNVRRFPQPQ
jgi:hypothetical protein